MYIVPIHNGVSIATSKVQMPKTGQHNTKQYNGASDEMFVLHKMTSWVMVLMYFGLLLALIMQESYNMAQNPCSMDLSTEWHYEGDMKLIMRLLGLGAA